MVNGPPKNESRQILSKSQNLAEPTNGSRSLRFCVCRSQICFSITSLHFFVSGSDLPFATPKVLGLIIISVKVDRDFVEVLYVGEEK